jgi:Peptidase family M41.
MLLGGRAAEEIMFNEVSTGAENDLKEATNISYQMVCNYGMSELGNRIYDIRMVKSTDKIDAEVNKIINYCYTNAKKILIEKKDKIILIAERLLSNEIITKEEIDELMNDEKQMCV